MQSALTQREEPMFRSMKNKAAWLAATTVLLSGLSFAQPRDHDDDDNRGRSTKDYRHDHDKDKDKDRDHDRRWKDHDRDDRRWNDHDRDDRRWNDHDRDDRRWNDHDRDDRYRRDGYWGYRNDNRVYPQGGYGSPNYGYYPGGNYGYGNSGYGNYGRGRGNSGYNFGYQDGAMVARQDMAERKPYHPDVRGKYEDADHGYNSGMGDKQAYRSQYMSGYRAGYVATFRGRY